MNRYLLVFLALSTVGAFGCQEVEQPKTVLTQEQWKEVKKYILDKAPTPKYKVGANFENKIELIGFDVDEPLQAGKQTTFTWYWKALDNVGQNWKVFVHFDSAAKPFRQNLDHVPVMNMYATGRWKKGQIIKDVQKVTIQGNYPPGKATPYIGFYRGSTRMKISNDVPKTSEAQPRVIGPTLTVRGSGNETAAAKKQTLPSYWLRQVKKSDATAMKVDGKLDEAVWKRIPSLQLTPFGNAARQLTWVKAFITDDALYVGAFLTDGNIWGTMKNRDDETWKQEVLEMFLDPDGDGKDYLELQVTPNNTVFDARYLTRLGTGKGTRAEQIDAAKKWNLEGLKTAVNVKGTVNNDKDHDQSWTIEMRLPLDKIPGLEKTKPKVGDTWRMNFYRFDRPKKGTTWAYAWSTAPRGDFHQVDKFGHVHVSKVVDLKQPTVTPAMLKQIRKNIDLKVRPVPIAKPRHLALPQHSKAAPAPPVKAKTK